MARKSRKRRRPRRPSAASGGDAAAGSSSAEVGAAPAPARKPARRRAGRDEAPPAPWGSFPLVELAVLAALVLLVAGFFSSGTRSVAMIGAGLMLGSVAGLELSIREHLAGYRSHTMILAGAPAILTLAGLFVLADSLSPVVRLAIALAVFGAGALLFTRIFRHRSGGATFRVRGFRG